MLELLVAMALAGVVMAGIYSAYYTQQKSAIVQQQTAAMSQNLRAGMDLMARDIRMAGYDPKHTASAGFVSDFPSPENGKGAGTDSGRIAFTMDADGSGAIDSNSSELIGFRLNGNALQIFTTTGTNWQTVADNIDAVNFVYLDGSGNVTANLNDIRSVQITMVARVGRGDPGYTDTNGYSNQQGTQILAPQNDSFRRRLLTTEVTCRNLGLD